MPWHAMQTFFTNSLVFESCWLSRELSANETELKNIKNSKKMYLFRNIFTLNLN